MNSNLRILREDEKPPNSSSGGDSGDGGNMNLESRVARIEAHIEHMDKDIGEIKSDIKSNFKWLLSIFGVGFSILLGGGIAGFLELSHLIAKIS